MRPSRQSADGWPRWDQLEKFGICLTSHVEPEPPPLLARPELTRLITAGLLARGGANVALVGPVGSGKGSALRILARQLSAREGPHGLRGRQMFAIDAARLLEGARYRGDLESRLRKLGRETVAAAGQAVIVLERPQLLVDGDSPTAPVLLADLLATGGWILPVTAEQATRLGSAVPLWSRLLAPVEVPPWSDADAIDAATASLGALCEHHRVDFEDEAAPLAVRLTRRYLAGQALPGGAVTLLDRAASVARVDSLPSVGRAGLVSVVAQQTGLPLAGLDATLPGTGHSGQRWTSIESRLEHRVVAQPRAVKAVSTALRRARAGIGDGRRPLGSFLFIGPTGVGKTETARVVAEFLFGDEDALVRVDMSEYMERHSVARLIGAPPGYVGFELPGQLTDPVRRRPFSVILIDEADKAHPDVLNLLLQILEDGRLTDGCGRTVDFRHTVIVLTSNAGSTEADHRRDVDAGRFYHDAARRLLRPELLNRLDDVVLFDELSAEALEQIVDLEIEKASRRLRDWGVRLSLSPQARRTLAASGHDPEYGARPLRRLIEHDVLDPVAAALLAGRSLVDIRPGLSVHRDASRSADESDDDPEAQRVVG